MPDVLGPEDHPLIEKAYRMEDEHKRRKVTVKLDENTRDFLLKAALIVGAAAVIAANKESWIWLAVIYLIVC